MAAGTEDMGVMADTMVTEVMEVMEAMEGTARPSLPRSNRTLWEKGGTGSMRLSFVILGEKCPSLKRRFPGKYRKIAFVPFGERLSC